MIQNCNEQILNDVIRVDLVPSDLCDLAVPFSVSGLTTMAGTKQQGGQTVDRIGAPALSLAYSMQDGDDGEIDDSPTLNLSEKQQAAGFVVTHDLQVPVSAFFQATREAVAALQGKDFHAVLTTGDGVRYLCYSVPNASSVTLEEHGINSSSTVRVQLQSMSHIIQLT